MGNGLADHVDGSPAIGRESYSTAKDESNIYRPSRVTLDTSARVSHLSCEAGALAAISLFTSGCLAAGVEAFSRQVGEIKLVAFVFVSPPVKVGELLNP